MKKISILTVLCVFGLNATGKGLFRDYISRFNPKEIITAPFHPPVIVKPNLPRANSAPVLGQRPTPPKRIAPTFERANSAPMLGQRPTPPKKLTIEQLNKYKVKSMPPKRRAPTFERANSAPVLGQRPTPKLGLKKLVTLINKCIRWK